MKNKIFIIVGSIFILSGLLMLVLPFTIELDNKEEKIIASSDEYMRLSIPKIKLDKPIYKIDDKMNDVDKGIELLTTDTPDQDNSKIVLASHSGNSKISYFKKLNKIKKGNLITLKYEGKTYTYKYEKKYSIKKNGKAKIITKKNKRSLALITCDKKNKKKQWVYIAYQISVDEDAI
jgi:LPXTG-site transpeptidase (sortase) family protein